MTSIVKPNPDSEASKKQQVEEMFDHISPKYDFLNHLLSMGVDRGWRKITRRRLASRNPVNILDVATGTGDLAIELSKIPGAKITGLDLSKGMLRKAESKVISQKLENRIRLIHGDSENLPMEDNTFDAVTVAFGVRNFENLNKGLLEIHRVLKPGAVLAVLEFSKPKNKILSRFYWFYFRNILPGIGKFFSSSSNAYSYLPESVKSFPEGKEFAGIAQNCGFNKVEIIPLSFGISTLYLCEK